MASRASASRPVVGHHPQAPAEQVRVLELGVTLHRGQRHERIARDLGLEDACREVLLQVRRRAVGDDLPVEDEGEAVALLGLVHVVRGDQHRHAALGDDLVDEVPEQPAPARIDAAGGFVEEQQLGLVQQRGGQRDPLPLARREPGGELAQPLREAQAVGEFGDARLQRGVAEPVDGPEEAEVLLDREVGVERELLAHVAEPPLPRLGVAHDVETAEPLHRPGRGRQQPGQHADRRGLARPVRAEEAEHAAARQVEADLVGRDERAETAREVADLDEGAGRVHASSSSIALASLPRTKTSSSDGASGDTASGATMPASVRRTSPSSGLSRDALAPADVQPRAEQREVVHGGEGAEPSAHLHAVHRLHLDERARIRREDLVARAERAQPPAIEVADARRVLGLVHVRRRDEDRDAVVVQAVEDGPELAPRHRVDARGRLVQQQQLGLGHQRRHERQLLLHAAGQRAREARAEPIEPHARQEIRRAGPAPRPSGRRTSGARSVRFSSTVRSS